MYHPPKFVKSDPPRAAPTFKDTAELASNGNNNAVGSGLAEIRERWSKNSTFISVQRFLENDSNTARDNLEQQRYALVSYVHPDLFTVLHSKERNYHGFLLKVRGVFPSKETAEFVANLLLTRDPHFPIHLIPMFRWVPLDNDLPFRGDEELSNAVVVEGASRYVSEQRANRQNLQKRVEQTATPLPVNWQAPQLTTDNPSEEEWKKHISAYLDEQPDRPAEITKFFIEATKPTVNILDLKPTPEVTLDLNTATAVAEVPKAVNIVLEDDLPWDPDQQWMIASFVLPSEMGGQIALEDGRVFRGFLLKLRGCFAKESDADAYASYLASADQFLDVHMLPMLKWAPADDGDENERAYADPFIKGLMEGFRDQQKDLARPIDERKQRAMQLGNLQKLLRSKEG